MTGKRKPAAEPTKVHLANDDYEILVTYIENKANFAAIYGTDKKPTVGGPPKKNKSSAFEDMATYLYVNSTNYRLPRLSGDQLKNRWRTYMNKFRATLALDLSGTGLGLTKSEMELGISIQDKLERKCPQFQRMKNIFGGVPNVNPAKTLELGLPASISGRQSDRGSESQCGGDGDVASRNDADCESDVSTDYGEDIIGLQTNPEPALDVPQNDGNGVELDSDTMEADDSRSEKVMQDGCILTAKCSSNQESSVAHNAMRAIGVSDDLIPSASSFDAAQSSISHGHQSEEDGQDEAPSGTRCDLAAKIFGISSSSESEGDTDQQHNEPPQLNQGVKGKQAAPPVADTSLRRKSATKTAGKKRSDEASSKTGKHSAKKKTRTSAHQKSLSLAEAHLDVSLKKQEMQQDFLYDQLTFNKQKWAEEKADKRLQQELGRERREQEIASRKSTERHQFLIALVKQGNPPSEIKELLSIYDAND